jgi:hypothetical protein
MMFDWSRLGFGVSHPLIAEIERQWNQLLIEDAHEQDCHEFLRKNATLFLADGVSTYVAISKLKLGSSLELDFAIPRENHSAGLFWELIELKGPGDPPYNAKGLPSAKLNQATQQIRDWKRWIIDSRGEAQRIFSLWSLRTQRQPNFQFTIIIGTRENSARWADKRNDYAKEHDIRVRSFDYLSDRLKTRVFLNRVMLCDGSWDNDHPELGNALANPFVQAYSDSEWKKLLSNPKVSGPHFFARSCDEILASRKVNEELVNGLRAEIVAKRVAESDV